MSGSFFLPGNLRVAGVVVGIVLSTALGAVNLSAEEDSGKIEPERLELLNREVVVFRSDTTQLSPAERVDDATRRIRAAGDSLLESGIDTVDITVGDDEEPGVRFSSEGEFLFTILESDLNELSGETLREASKRAISQINDALDARAEQFQPERIALGIGVVVGTTALFLLGIWLIRRVGGWLRGRLEKFINRIRQLKIKRADLRPHIVVVEKKAVRLLEGIAIFFLGYVWLTTCLYQFPATAPWGAALGQSLGQFASKVGSSVLGSLPGLGIVTFIFLIARWLSRLSDHLIRGLGSESASSLMSADTARATRRIIGATIWLFAIVMSYPYIPGSGSVAFQGMSMLLGLMISLGSSGMINQIMSGFVMLYSGSIRTGEYVRVGEMEGTVTEMGLLATKIMTPRRDFISVPNAILVSNPTYNYSRLADENGAVVSTSVTIGYDTPWRQVHAMLKLASERTPGLRQDPEPRVLQTGLLDHYAEYTLVFYIEEPTSRPAVLSRLHAEIQDVFNEYEVQIMSPHFREQPEQDLIVPKSNWFDKPAAEPRLEQGGADKHS